MPDPAIPETGSSSRRHEQSRRRARRTEWRTGTKSRLWTRKSVMSTTKTTKSLWVILGQLGLCTAVAELSSRH